MNVSKESSEALTLLYGSFFDLNATLDRCVEIMQNDWAMPQAADIVHNLLAHAEPLIADMITESKGNWNESSYRPSVHEDKRNYSDLKDMFETVLKEHIEVYEMIKMCVKVVREHSDFNMEVDLIALMQVFNKFIAQIIMLRDKAIQMPNQYDTFDRHITSWKIIGLGD